MNTNSEMDRIVADWLGQRVADPPHGSLQAVIASLDDVPQQRHRWLRPWSLRDPGEGRLARGLHAGVLVAGVAVLALAATFALPLPTAEPEVAPTLTGTTLNVAASGTAYDTIGSAIAAAEDGDTILVAPGRYDEALTIDKDITLRGSGDEPRDVAIYVPDDAPAPVEAVPPLHQSLHGPEMPALPPVGIQLLDSSATVANLQVVGLDDGIAVLVRGGAPALDTVVLSHRSYLGLATDCGDRQQQEHFAGGLFVLDAAELDVTQSQVWHTVRIDGGSSVSLRDGFLQFPNVAVQGASQLELVGNSIWAGNAQPLSVTDGSSATVRTNKFHGGGIDIHGSAGAVVGATIEGNSFDAAPGTSVYVTTDVQATIADNRFVGNANGVTISHADATVRDNRFVSNATAVNLSGSHSKVTGNTVSGGEVGMRVVVGGAPTIRDNTIDGTADRGIIIGGRTRPIVEGNRVCGSAINLHIEPTARPTLADNDICPDGSAMTQ